MEKKALHHLTHLLILVDCVCVCTSAAHISNRRRELENNKPFILFSPLLLIFSLLLTLGRLFILTRCDGTHS